MESAKSLGLPLYKRANSLSKILLFLLSFIGIVMARSPLAIFSTLIYLSFLTIFLHVGFKRALISLKGVAVFSIFVFFMNAFFYTRENPLFSFWIFYLTEEGIINGLRFAFIVLMLTLLSYLTLSFSSPEEMGEGITHLISPLRKLSVNVSSVSFVISLSFSFVPFLIAESKTIKRAQISRSPKRINRLFLVFTIILPMFISSFRRADELSMAMEARGFRGVFYRKERLLYSSGDAVLIGVSSLYLMIQILFLIMEKYI